MPFEFKDPGPEGTSTLETTAWRVASEPFVEEFCSVEGEHPDSNCNFDEREEKPTSSEHIFGKPPKKPGGARILDKAVSGEYVLGRPPKKPGGTLRLFLTLLILLLTGVACESVEDEASKKWGLRHILFLMFAWFLLKVVRNWIFLEYIKWIFGNKADEFLSQFSNMGLVERLAALLQN